jgi:hypothetical protein
LFLTDRPKDRSRLIPVLQRVTPNLVDREEHPLDPLGYLIPLGFVQQSGKLVGNVVGSLVRRWTAVVLIIRSWHLPLLP